MTVGDNTVYINKPIRAESGIMSPSIVLRSGNDDVTISAAIAGDIIKSASIVNTNTLSLVSISGTVVNFSKATSLDGAWSGNTYTVTATPQGNSIHTSTFTSLPEWDIMNNKATVDFYYFDNNNISTRILPATININSKLLNKTGNNKFERNGTYNAHSAGYIGYGEIVIDVPQGIESSNIRTKFSGAPGSYYIEAVDNQTSTPISGTTTQYNLGARSQYVEIQTTSGARMPGGAYVTLGLNRGTITSSGTRDVTVTVDGVDTIVSQHFTDYSDGYAGAHLSGHWGTGANNYNVWTVEKVSTGNANGISTTITSGLSDFTYNPSTHKYSVTAYAYADDVQKYSMVGATGTEAYDAGFSAVKIAVTKTGNVYNIAKSTAGVYSSKLTVTTAPPDFNYNTSGHYFEVTGRAIVNGSTVSTATRNTSTVAYTAGWSDARLYGSWDANKYTVTKVSNGSLSASITVTAGTPAATYNSATHAYDIVGTAYAGGECRHMATVSTGSGAYDAGWSAVRLSGTWSGNKYTVKKANSGKTTDSITVLASTGFNYNTSGHYFEIEGNAIVDGEAISTATSNTSTAAWTAGVTEGYSGAHLYGHWGTGANNYNVWTVEKVSTGTANAISVTVTSGLSSFTYHSDTHKYSVTAYAYGNSDQKHSMSGSTGTEAYEAGFSAVRLSSSWSGNKWTVKKGTDGSPSDAEITVTAGSPTATYNSANHCYDMVGTAWALGACRHKATNSTDTSAYTDGYSVGMRESTGGYASGWRECYSTVRLDSTEEKTLDYGSSIRVYAQAKTSSTAQTHTNIESRVIKAPNDRVCSLHLGSWESGKKKVDLIIDGTTASTQYAEISAMGDEWDTTISPTTSRYIFTAYSGKANATLDAGIIVNCCGSSAKFSVSTAVTHAFRDGYSAGYADSYQEGYDAGVASVRITPTWTKATESSTYSNKLTVTTSTDSTKDTSYNCTITAGLASLTYDSGTHKYSTTAYAYAGGATKDTKTGTSGDEAYVAGYSAGRATGITISSIKCAEGSISSAKTERTTFNVKATLSSGVSQKQAYTIERVYHDSAYWVEVKEGSLNVGRISGMPIYNSGVSYANKNVVPFLCNAVDTIWDNRITSITTNGDYYVRAVGRDGYAGNYTKYADSHPKITVNVSRGTSYTLYPGYNTNDKFYYGKLYNSAGVALTTSSYYWYGCTSTLTSEGLTSVVVYK